MAASNSAWGIEIGSGGIKAVKVAADGETARVLDFIAIQHPKVLSTPDVDKDDVLRVSLGRLVSERDLSGSPVLVSIPGHQSFARFAKLPPVEPKKIPDIVKFEAVQQVPFPLEEVEWDYQTFVSPDSPEVEVGIFAVTKERVKQQLDMLGDVGITPDGVTISPLSVFNALAHDLEFKEDTQGTIILDIGTTATDLIIYEAGRVWIRTFPMGGHNFTNQLVESFKLGYPKAEKLKREADQSQHARHILQAMRPVFTDLAQDVQRSIGYYQSLHKDAKLTRLIGLGATFHLPGLRKYLKQQLGMEVYRLEEWKRPIVSDLGDERATQFHAAAMEMSTAYGLAIQGVGLQTIDANLIPTNVVRDSMWKKKAKWFGMAAGVGLLAGGVMFARPILDQQAIAAADNDREALSTIDNVVRQASQLRSEAEQARVLGSAQVDPRAARVLGLLEKREAYTWILNDIGAMLADAESRKGAFLQNNAITPEQVPQGPVWRVESVQTQYEIDANYAAAPANFREQAVSAAVGDPAPSAPRVVVTMEVSTYMPEFERFFAATLPRWLEQNGQRQGLEYMLHSTTSSTAAPTRRTGGQRPAAATNTQQQATPEITGGTGRRGGDRREGQEPTYDLPVTMTPEEARRIEAERIARGEIEVTGRAQQTGRPGASSVDTNTLDGLAPITEPKPNEGRELVTYTVTWSMVLQAPPAPAGQSGGESGGEGGGL
ncbi:MAG: type IV pilus assembly protein PilM [Phycisphaerales bacterium]